MALVIYNPLPFMEHFNTQERIVAIEGLPDITIAQDWNAFGVAAVVWEAALILGTFLQSIQDKIKGKDILELGSGTGICGIVASLLGANVTLTDLESCLHPCKINTKTNLDATLHNFQVKPLDWKEDLEKNWSGHAYDYIIGADLVYIEDLFEDLIRTFEHFAKCNENTTILLAGKIRYIDKYKRFKRIVEKKFTLEHVTPNNFSGDIYIMKIKIKVNINT